MPKIPKPNQPPQKRSTEYEKPENRSGQSSNRFERVPTIPDTTPTDLREYQLFQRRF